MSRPVVTFEYTNHRGEVAQRTVTVDSVEWIPEPGYGYAAGFFLSGHCHTKNMRRSFAFANMRPPAEAPAGRHYYLLQPDR